MTLHRGLYLATDGSSLGTVPIDARLATSGLIAVDASSAIGFRAGVFYDGLGNVVTGTATTGTMTYSMRGCRLAITLLGPFSSGACILANDGPLTVTTTAAPGSNSRIDVIWVRQQAVAADGGSDVVNTAILGCTQGTPGAVPTVPAIPTGAYALAQAVVTAGTTHTDTTTITQVHNWTAAAGAPVPVRNNTEQLALTAYDGMRIYRLDLSTWLTYNAIAGGFVQDGYQMPAPGASHQPRRLLARITTFSLADSSLVPVGMTATSTGDDGNGTGLSLSGQPVTALYSGLYRVAYSFFFPAQSGGARQISIYKNATIGGGLITGGTQLAFQQQLASSATGVSAFIGCDAALSAGDTITPGAFQSSGGAMTVGSTVVGAVYLHIHRVDNL